VASLVVAASLARAGSDEAATPAEPLMITGAAALGGFTYPGSASPAGDTEATPTSDAGAPVTDAPTRVANGSTESHSEDHPVREVAQVGPQEQTPLDTSEAPETTANPPVDPSEVVHRFYELVQSDPDRALDLLGPSLAADAREQLLTAWRSLTGIRVVHVNEQADGSVRVVVTMIPERGAPVRLTQRLAFATAPEVLISDVTLLSVLPG
jgi:hypothetical protein